MSAAAEHADDLRLAFEFAPVGLLVSRSRVIRSYNSTFCEMFGYAPTALEGQSLERLYPSLQEYEHIGERAHAAIHQDGTYADERIMRKADGSLYWCRVKGRGLDQDDPFAAAVWVFEDLSAQRPVGLVLTAREREVAQFIVLGRTSKQVAQDLGVGHRTVEAHRARLMRKYRVSTTSELIACLLGR